MTHEEAINEIKSWDFLNEKEIEAIQTLIPELRESEDERIRKDIIRFLEVEKEDRDAPFFDTAIAYLEKQKENPKNADSIPADCVSSAKCEDRWHKTANSLPDDGRDVLAKDALGNYLLASFDGAQWFVSVYDGQDHPVLHTPPILEWCEIPSEKQKEQKPELYDMGRWDEESYNNGIHHVLLNPERFNLQPKEEWSEEDEKMRDRIIDILNRTFSVYSALGTSSTRPSCPTYKDEIAWLKSLRPSWKPSEEHLSALLAVFNDPNNIGSQTCQLALTDLYEHLKKL